jgi:hypothetical protein
MVTIIHRLMKKDLYIIKKYLKENIKQEYLPFKLIQRINQEIFTDKRYEYRTKNNFLRCIGTIYFKQVNEHYGLEGYVPTGSAYWKQVFGNDYHEKVIQPLINLGIIEFLDFGYRNYPNVNTSKGKEHGMVGIRYRINPKLTNEDEFATIEYIRKNNLPVLTAEEMVMNEGKELEYLPVSQENLFISIDKQRATEWVEDNAEDICNQFLNTNIANELPENTLIPCHIYLDGGSFNIKYLPVKMAEFEALLQDKQLFFFKDAFYLADINTFLKYRISNLKYHYKHDISKIGTVPLIYRRSDKTLRITTNLTNFPSKILQFININNQTVVQFDLRTSQFLIFANLLNIYITKGDEALQGLFKHNQTKVFLIRFIAVLAEHRNMLPQTGVDIANTSLSQQSTSDVIRFIHDVFFNDFYAVIQKQFGFSERGSAKLVLFMLLFKRNTKSDKLIDTLKEHYPTVMAIIEGFKTKSKESKPEEDDKNPNDDTTNLSVFLQCVESEIFIDRILFPLRDMEVPCFTRHDSIVVAHEYANLVEDVIKSVFSEIGFKYNYKVEDKFWEVVDCAELENSPYSDYMADEDILNTDYSVEKSFDEPESDEINENDNIMDEQLKETCLRLQEIGIHDDYYQLVDADFLEEISNLPLNQHEKIILMDEVINQRNGMAFFQESTNILIQKVVGRIGSIVFLD